MTAKLSSADAKWVADALAQFIERVDGKEIAALKARNATLEAELIEATAELIYLRQHGKDGAVWWANESKDVWRGKAIAALSMTRP